MEDLQNKFMSPDEPFEKRIKQMKEILSECKGRVVFIGGAGVSTGSGIPDFRSPNGLYNNIAPEYAKYKPEYLLGHSCYAHKPDVFYGFYRRFLDTRSVKPCMVHKKLAELEQEGYIKAIVTQNIDMLHEAAGSKNVYKIHGTSGMNHCVKCGRKYDWNWFFDNPEKIPKCECGHQVRPNVTLYGEKMPMDAYNKAYDAIINASCMIVAGTTLQVGSAANLALEFTGQYIIVVNNEPTLLDEYADVCFREDMNVVFAKL